MNGKAGAVVHKWKLEQEEIDARIDRKIKNTPAWLKDKECLKLLNKRRVI